MILLLGCLAFSALDEQAATRPASMEASTLPASAPQRVAVWLRREGLSDRQARILEAYTLSEIGKLEGLEAVAASSAEQNQKSCPAEDTCLARLAAALGTARVVVVDLRTADRSEVLTLKLMDMRTGEIENVSTQMIERKNGALTILSQVVRALFPAHPPRSGVAAAVAETEAKRWNPPPLPKSVFFTGVGLTVASLATAIGLSIKSLDAQERYSRLAGSGEVVSGAELRARGQELTTWVTSANSLWIATSVLAVGTLLTVFWTDFGSDVVLAPVLDARMVGATAMMRF